MDTLEARLRAAGRRVRAMRALEAAVWGAAGAAGVAAGVALAHWVSPAHVPLPGLGIVVLLLVVPGVAALIAISREVAQLPVLLAFDRSHGLSDLLSTAWALARVPDDRRGPFVAATLERAERAAAGVELWRTFPWRRPRGLVWLATAVVAAAASVFGATSQPTAAASVAGSEASPAFERLVSPEQLASFRARLARLDANTLEPPTPARAELERILDELGQPADRLQVLRRLGDLERRARPGANRAETAGQSTAARGGERSSAKLPPSATEPAPPSEHTQPAAAPAPAEGAAPPATAAAATEKPSAPQPSAAPAPAVPEPQTQERAASAEPKGDDSPDPGAPPPPQSGGQSTSPPAAKEARPVAASASRGGKDDNGPRGPDLERNRAPQNPPRDRGENLADAISELRDLMRRDQSVHADLEGSDQAPQLPRDRPDPKRDDSKGNRPGAPNAAYASGGPPQVGTEAGDSKNEDLPKLPAAATRISGVRSDGPVRSRVIYGAAQRGFAGGDYARVHAEYEDHAERELESESVPPGYRGYVRRYFEAIAPRKTP
ncbi:MAG TPA: hypothetical protein VFG30_36965 [Polyangiales bacterium]|nr:hypothetical protein [Polyangiales bacterium]